MQSRGTKLLFGLTLAAAASFAHAVPITVLNPSFESPDTATYTTLGSITSWTGTSSTGVFQPASYLPVGALTPNVGGGFIAGVVGDQTAYINQIGSIAQTLASTLAAGTYTLKVDVGDRADFTAPALYTIELLEGATVLASITQANFAPVNDDWIETTLTHISAGTGTTLGIRLSGTSTTSQVNFDNVRLDFVAAVAQAPEPGTLALLGLGLAGLAASRRRKQ